MKIAISSTGPDPDAQIDLRFGRCQCFVLADDKAEQFEVLDNSAAASASGAGIQASQMIADAGVQVVITGNIGTNATKTLQAAGIKTYHCGPGTVRKALQKYIDGMLQETSGYKVGGAGAGGGFRRGGEMGGGRGLGGGVRRA